MVAAATKFLGIGMYTPAETAMYARISSRMMSRWIHGDGAGAAAIRAQVPDDSQKTGTFLDFIQVMAVRAIREQRKTITLQKIRQAIETVTNMGDPYPFARRHATYLLNDEIHIQVEDKGLVQASGRQRGQYAMKQIVEIYLDDLSFDSTGLANEYTAYESAGVKIVMRPGIRFGEPVVLESQHTAWTLWQACMSEGSVEAAAKAYGVPVNEVRVAFKYIDSIRPATAA